MLDRRSMRWNGVRERLALGGSARHANQQPAKGGADVVEHAHTTPCVIEAVPHLHGERAATNLSCRMQTTGAGLINPKSVSAERTSR